MRLSTPLVLLCLAASMFAIGCGSDGGQRSAPSQSYALELRNADGLQLPARVHGPNVELAAPTGFEVRFWPGVNLGVGLMVVTQRPSDVDSAVLSQCGTMIALRVTNQRDRAAVASTIPDDLGDLSELLPALRTGEALVLGDALQVPSRIRVDKAIRKPVGEDPPLPAAWLSGDRPDSNLYRAAVRNWRRESTSVTET